MIWASPLRGRVLSGFALLRSFQDAFGPSRPLTQVSG